MKMGGSCHCGAISYEASGDPERAGICLCTDCQKFSGGVFRIGIVAKEENFTLLLGSPKTYVKTAESGASRARVFCSYCGTHTYSTSVGDAPKKFRIKNFGFGHRRQINAARSRLNHRPGSVRHKVK